MSARSCFSLLLALFTGCLSLPPATSLAVSYAPARVQAPAVQKEFRGAWVATVHNIDWPSKRGLSATRQKAELITILNKAKALNMNAIIFQVRPSCDALYNSSIEPWSPWLTGTMGKSPGYDPLAFAVAEAHARGMELHAWFNPFRALASVSLPASSNHVTKRYPSWVRKYEGKVWLDPGLPQVRSYALSVIADVVARYDIDGVHIDDYFYPYPKNPKVRPVPQFPDLSTYKKYSKGQSRGDWRRTNINSFVASMYSTVKKKKPWVKVGISPFGIWRPQVPRGVKADLDAFNMLYADSRTWLVNGWVDYMTPQLYWPIKGDQSFSRLISWWDSQNTRGRQVWPGIASDRIGVKRSPREIGDQISLARSSKRKSTAGHVHWSMSSIMDNKRGVADMLAKNFYQSAAIVPPVRGVTGSAPGQPTVKARVEGSTLFIDFAKGGGNPAVQFIVQTQSGRAWSSAQLVSGVRKGMKWELGKGGPPEVIAVTGIDRYGNAGPATTLVRR